LFVGVPAEGAEHVAAAAPKSGKPHAFTAGKAAIRLAWRKWRVVLLLLGYQLKNGCAARRAGTVDDQGFRSNLLSSNVNTNQCLPKAGEEEQCSSKARE